MNFDVIKINKKFFISILMIIFVFCSTFLSFGAAAVQNAKNQDPNSPDKSEQTPKGVAVENAQYYDYVEYDDQGNYVDKHRIVITKGEGGLGEGGGSTGLGGNKSDSSGKKENNGGEITYSINGNIDELKKQQIDGEIKKAIDIYKSRVDKGTLDRIIQQIVSEKVNKYEEESRQLESIAKQREENKPEGVLNIKPVEETTTIISKLDENIEKPTSDPSETVRETTTQKKVIETSEEKPASKGLINEIINFFSPKKSTETPDAYIETTTTKPIDFVVETETIEETTHRGARVTETKPNVGPGESITKEQKFDMIESEEIVSSEEVAESVNTEVVAEEMTAVETTIQETTVVETVMKEITEAETQVEEVTKEGEKGEMEETTEGEYRVEGGFNEEDGKGDGKGATNKGVRIFELKRKGNIGIKTQNGINVIQGLVYSVATILLLLIGILYYILPNALYDKFFNKSKYLI